MVDASDFGRIKSVTVLNELYMRMAQSASIPRLLPDTERVHTLPAISDGRQPWEAGSQPWETRAHDPPPPQSRPIVRAPPKSPSILSSSPTDSTITQDSVEFPGSTGKKKWGIPFRSRTPRGSSNALQNTDTSKQQATLTEPSIRQTPPETQRTVKNLPVVRSTPTHDSHLGRPLSENWRPSPELRIDEDNPWQEEYSSASSVRDVASGSPNPKDMQRDFRSPQRQSTEQTYVDDGAVPAHEMEVAYIELPISSQTRLVASHPSSGENRALSVSPKGPPGSRVFKNMFGRRTSTEATQVEEKRPPLKRLDNSRKSSPVVAHKNSAPEPVPSSSAKDPYSGYCKGAYKLQVGLVKEGMKICNQSTSMTGQSNYWACASSKCCFEGGARQIGKTWEFDNTVRISQGIRYRWTLLAKSHIAMSKSKNHNYDYQCVFCTEQDQPAIVHHGEQDFLEHISTHRSQRSSLSKSEKIICKTGRLALDHEVFDINFPPLAENAQFHGRTLVNSPDIDAGNHNDTLSPEEEEGFEWSTPEPSIDDSPWQQQH